MKLKINNDNNYRLWIRKFIEILATGFNQGYDIKLSNNKLYVVDTGNSRIQIINLS